MVSTFEAAKKRVTAAAERATGQRYCSHGNHYVSPEGGYYKVTRTGTKRFVCASCRVGKFERRTKT